MTVRCLHCTPWIGNLYHFPVAYKTGKLLRIDDIFPLHLQAFSPTDPFTPKLFKKTIKDGVTGESKQ